MLIVGNEEEEVFSFYWRKKDILATLPERIEEACDDCKDIIEKIDGMPLEKAIKFINRNTDLDIAIEEAEIEGAVDAAILKRIENEVEFDGPELSVVKCGVKSPVSIHGIEVKKSKDCGCMTYIDGARVS